MTEVITGTGAEYLLSDAHCCSLADRIVVALAEGGGFAACTSVPQACLRRLVELLRERAASSFQVIVISRAPGNSPLRTASASGSAAPAALPPLFVIDDADRRSTAELRDICEAAPFSRDWAAVLSVRAALVTRRDLSELDFLKSRITASFHFRDLGHEEIQPFMFRQRPTTAATGALSAQPPTAPAAERATAGKPPVVPARRKIARLRHGGTRAAAGGAGGRGLSSSSDDFAFAPPAGAQAARRRDLRLYAFLGYLAIVGLATGCYLMLRAGGGP